MVPLQSYPSSCCVLFSTTWKSTQNGSDMRLQNDAHEETLPCIDQSRCPKFYWKATWTCPHPNVQPVSLGDSWFCGSLCHLWWIYRDHWWQFWGKCWGRHRKVVISLSPFSEIQFIWKLKLYRVRQKYENIWHDQNCIFLMIHPVYYMEFPLRSFSTFC